MDALDALGIDPGPVSPWQARALHCTALRIQALAIWTVYGPGNRDHPGLHLARLFLMRPRRGTSMEATPRYLLGASLEEIAEAVPPDLAWLERSPDDDPLILGIWI